MIKYVVAECPYCGWFWVPKGQDDGSLPAYRVPNTCPSCKKRFVIAGHPTPAGVGLQSIKLSMCEFRDTDELQKWLYEKRRSKA